VEFFPVHLSLFASTFGLVHFIGLFLLFLISTFVVCLLYWLALSCVLVFRIFFFFFGYWVLMNSLRQYRLLAKAVITWPEKRGIAIFGLTTTFRAANGQSWNWSFPKRTALENGFWCIKGFKDAFSEFFPAFLIKFK